MGVRLVVSAFVERGGRVLLLRRSTGRFAPVWELPGGKVELGEGAEEALVREVREETGLDVDVLGVVGSWWFLYDDATQFVVFVHRARSRDDEIGVRLDDDHDAFAWLTPGELDARYAALNAPLAERRPEAVARMAALVARYAAGLVQPTADEAR